MVDVFETIKIILINEFDVDENLITLDSHFVNTLKLDSLDIVDLALLVEQKFHKELPAKALQQIEKVDDLVRLLEVEK